MSRWIDAEWLCDELGDINMDIYTDEVKEYIDSAPSIEVVRCGECKWFNEKYGSCHAYHWDLNQGLEYAEVDADDFCSYGCNSSEKPNNSNERSSE